MLKKGDVKMLDSFLEQQRRQHSRLGVHEFPVLIESQHPQVPAHDCTSMKLPLIAGLGSW